MQQVIPPLIEQLERGERVAVATILSKHGPAPRGIGTKMLVQPSGKIVGTVGGGLLEARVIAAAKAAIIEGQGQTLQFDLSGKLGEGVDLICGGTTELLVDVIDPTELELFRTLSEALAARRRGTLVTRWRQLDHRCAELDRGLAVAGQPALGCCREQDPREYAHGLRHARLPQLLEEGERRVLAEPFASPCVVVLFGGGHVAQQVARLCSTVGFVVEIMDDRPEFANEQLFPQAAAVHRVERFKGALAKLSITPESYLVILTRGHRHDRDVLEQALGTEAGYIGMIGSRRKVQETYEALEQHGFERSALEAVHSPIGLSIGAQTPEEIAVSIVAELVAVRAQRLAR